MELKEFLSKSNENELKIDSFKNLRSKSDFGNLDLIDSSKENTEIVLLKLQNHETSIFQELSLKLRYKSALIFQETFDDVKSKIYWKSAEIEEFLTIKTNDKLSFEADQKLNEFVVDFLMYSVKINHLGLISKLSVQSGMKPISINLLADSRDFNMLLLAAERGNSEIVEILLHQGMNTNSLDNKVDAQTLAYQNQHFDALYLLLHANLKFPSSFDVNLCTDKCKEFCDVTEEVHNLIKVDHNEKLKQILNQHKNLKHFYNFSNESALKVAILSGSYDTYKELTSRKFRYAPHEDPAEYLEDLEFSDKKKVREIHDNFSDSIVDKHINVIIGNSFIYHNEIDGQDKQDIISRAYKSLDSIPLVRIILMIVAASKNFKIIFDFNRESVNVADPTVDSDTQGLFYVSGRVYIGAKQLLDTDTEHVTLANMAHELCHFTMNFVYGNQAKPYKQEDIETEKEFQRITEFCQQNNHKEDIVDVVFDAYRKKMHHAELIVRPVHMIVFYQNLPGKLEKVREVFIKLFDFYENKIVPELEKALEEIVQKDEKMLEKKDQKISKLRRMSIIGGVLTVVAIIAAIVIGIIFYTPTYSFNELNPQQQKIVENSSILYKSIKIKFDDLFPTNSSAYEMLTSDHISRMLHGRVLNLNDPQMHYLDELVTHSWVNLTTKLKDKFLTSNFTFQNENLKFKLLYELNPIPFDSLKSQQILDVLKNRTLIISNMIKIEAKFTVERKMFDENIDEIYHEFMHFINGNEHSCRCECFNATGNTKTFKIYYEEFKNQSLDKQFKKLDVIKRKEAYRVCPIESYRIMTFGYPHQVTDTLLSHTTFQFNFEDVLQIANETKTFILSAEAGTGKTVTFEQFTMRIKRKFPTRWVSYIDLKDHKDLYKTVKTLEDVKDMLEKIFELSDENKFEKEIFEELFKSGDTILLWNGFDEISPEFSDSVIKILGIIRNNTENIQFICTRPLYSEQLRNKFMTTAYTTIPFTAEEQKSFVRKFLIANKVDELKIEDYMQKIQSIVDSTEAEEGFDSPLLLGMIAELVSSDVEIYETGNLYELYRKFVEEKVQIWQENSASAKKLTKIFLTNGFSINRLHQKYAMRHELQSSDYTYKFAYFNALKLQVMRQIVPKELTNDEVSRMGILFINGPKTFKFAHRTFAEFFLAQYFVENIYNAVDEPSLKEAERRIRLFYHTFCYPFYRLRIFIKSFLKSQIENENQAFDSKISKVLRTKYQRLYFNSLKELNEIPLLGFWAKDNKVLTELLQVDANETFYTGIFNYNYYPEAKHSLINHTKIRDFGKKHLTESQYQNFINDKNQKGIILWSSYCMSLEIFNLGNYGYEFHENFTLDYEFRKNSDAAVIFESVANNLTNSELKVLLGSGLILNRKIFNTKLWNFIEKNLIYEELKDLLVKLLESPKLLIDSDELIFVLKKLEIFLNSDNEIYEAFLSTKILNTAASFRNYTFQPLWNFFVNHSTLDQQKFMLTRVVHNDCFARPFKSNEQLEYCYVFPPLNMLQSSLFSFEGLDAFNQVSKIYETYFNRTELQKIVLTSTSDFLAFLIVQGNQNLCNETIKHLKMLFTGYEQMLKKFLIQEVESTNLNVFQLLSDFHDYKNCLDLFTKFYNEL